MRFQRLRPGLALSGHLMLASAIGAASVPLFAQAPPAPQAQARPVDLPAARAILDRHVEAIGGRQAILRHSSMKVTGSISIPASGMTGTIETFAARPNKALVRITIPGIGDVLEGFDGTVGWSLSPMTGPALSEGKMLEEKRFESEFYGDLKDTSRYESMETIEKTTFDGRECFKVSLVRKGGGEDFEFYDVGTGLKAGQTGQRETPMGTVGSVQTYTDYRKFGDMLHPTTLKVSAMGVEQIFTFESIEYDTVDPSVFELPAQIKALVK